MSHTVCCLYYYMSPLLSIIWEHNYPHVRYYIGESPGIARHTHINQRATAAAAVGSKVKHFLFVLRWMSGCVSSPLFFGLFVFFFFFLLGSHLFPFLGFFLSPSQKALICPKTSGLLDLYRYKIYYPVSPVRKCSVATQWLVNIPSDLQELWWYYQCCSCVYVCVDVLES